ncbi:sulfite exporter TauE/SafE family protein [Frisingicoccus sp.]|uniref:sulfite exporter TauE/SafE family protein n=1 Tax=Frisingicoccus sp. TaxID=1918627 RepID=UPI003AB34A97
MNIALILAVNLLVGLCVGLTGIAGFLLPMFYSGFLGMAPAETLALSFAAFLISGVLGSVNYYKSKNLDLRTAMILSAGSFVGAIGGVRLNLLIPEDVMQTILYIVVLGSGVSILLRKDKKDTGAGGAAKDGKILCFGLGAVTGVVCAASGAGGPVLVMPLLTLLGFSAHMAIGIALFDSIFIALPAIAGYFFNARLEQEMWMLIPVILAVHAVGVFFGSRNASKINQTLLKRVVAVGSVAIACLKLFLI